jgi:RHS repeat-associated protein
LGALALLALGLAVSVATPATALATEAPIASYSFDEAEGEVAHDSSGNEHDGAIVGAGWASGKYGSALDFDAEEGDVVTIPDSEDLRVEDFTLEAWVRSDESRLNAPIVAKTDLEGYGYALFAGADSEGTEGHVFGFISYHQWVNAHAYGDELPAGAWTHVAVTNDGEDIALYVNGALVDERESEVALAGEGPLQIGGSAPFVESYFDGKIDEVRVYDRALDAEEVRDDKKTAIQTPPSQAPIATYAFDENEGSVAHDSSGNGNDGAIEGADWASGKYGSALDFDAGEGDVVTVPDSEDLHLEDFTLEAWVRPDEDNFLGSIVAHTDPEGYGYALFTGAGEEGFEGYLLGFISFHQWVNAHTFGEKPPVGSWTHVALTNDGKDIALYVNGELIDERESEAALASGAPLRIGGDEPFAEGHFFDGKIDEVRVYDRALDAEEVAEDSETESGPHPPIRFVHDADGRLEAMIEPHGETAVYDWDAAGNLLSITRHPSAELSILQLSPAKAEVGETVTIEGTGFSGTPGSNTVEFNGTPASVISANGSSLTVQVPGGATTGPVTVATGEESASSPASFSVVGSSVPHIASLSTIVAKAGDEVTASGSNFAPGVSGNIVVLNGSRASVVEGGSSSIKFAVPQGTLGSHLTVTTMNGSDVGPDLFVPPGTTLTSQVKDTDRFSLGGSTTAELPSSESAALEIFEGTAGQHVGLTLSESSLGGVASIWTPRGSKLLGGEMAFGEGGSGLEKPVPLPETGTYTVLVKAGIGQSGSVKLAASTVDDVTGSIVPTSEGAEESVSLATPYQDARYSVKVRRHQVVSVETANASFSGGYRLEWRDSEGNLINWGSWPGTTSAYWTAQEFKSAGTYTLIVNPEGAATGSVDLTLWDATSPSGLSITPTEAGESKTFSVAVPGQVPGISFAGTAGDRVILKASEVTFTSGWVAVHTPSGSLPGNEGLLSKSSPQVLEMTLPVTGTYTIYFLAGGNGTGSAKFTAYKSPADLTGSITPTEGGEKKSLSLAVGQNARYSVSASAGEIVSLETANASFDGNYYLEWRDSEGKLIDSSNWSGTSSSFWKAQEFKSAGTYTLVVNPQGTATGSIDLTLWDASPPSGLSITPTEAGESKTFSVAVPGQAPGIDFAGTAGEKVLLKVSEVAFNYGWVAVHAPSGSMPGNEGALSKAYAQTLEMTLPATGTYTIYFVANGSETGSAKFTAYKSPADLTGSITPTEGGAKKSLSLAVGQNARYSVSASAGEVVSLETANASFDGNYRLEWRDSEGNLIDWNNWSGTTSAFWKAQEFKSAGTYTLVVNPEGAATGSVDLTLWDATSPSGLSITPTEAGESKTFSVAAPGQVPAIKFEGTKGDRVILKASEVAFNNGWVAVGPPSGSLPGNEGPLSKSYAQVLEMTLPVTGTYTIYFVANGGETGSVKFTAYKSPADLTGSITPTEGGAKKSLSLAVGQNARYSVSASAGEVVSLETANASFSSGYRLEWRDSEGNLINWNSWSGSTSTYWTAQEFKSAGTYTLVVNPEGAAAGSVDLTLWDATSPSGLSITPTEVGESKTFSVAVPGQVPGISFEGTEGDSVTLKASEVAFNNGWVAVHAPSGSMPGNEGALSKAYAQTLEMTLPATGTYTIYFVANGGETGSVKFTAYLESGVSWRGPMESSATFASLELDPPGRSGGRLPPIDQGHAPRAESESRSESDHPSSPERRAAVPPSVGGEKLITPEMRAFRPDAEAAWHPPRTRRGVKGWEAGEPQSPWAKIVQRSAPAGTTALAGQVLALDGLPLAGVRVSLDGTEAFAFTDATGRFLLAGAPSGHQRLIVEGESRGGRQRYGTYEVGVDLADHETTTLDYTIWLTPLDRAGDQPIASPTRKETRLTTPRIPGLEVRIPAGTEIRDAAGHPVKKLNISAVPVDRPPFPLPPFVPVPMYFTVQPGRAYLSKGAQIVYPNWAHLPPGQRVDFWNYDPDDRGWYVYGHGTVTDDGKQVMPDPGVRVWKFSGAMIASVLKAAAISSLVGAGMVSGDPVDLYTGLFTYRKSDLEIPDTLPISMQRTYRPLDSNSYSFGIGTTSPYDIRLWSETNYTEADLVLPDGSKVHYVRTSPGVGYIEAVYEPTGPAGPYAGSKLEYNLSTPGFDLKLANGITFMFGEVAPLQAIRDRYGNTLTLTRESGQNGNITRITSPHGRWVKLSYDESNRITDAVDNGGRHLEYTYASGRLTKVKGLDGRVTEYEYDGSGRMKAVINARGNKYLQVAYDANGRVEKQIAGDGAIFEFDYDLDGEGKVEATAVTDPEGNQRKVTFDAEGFPVEDTYAPGTELEQTTSFERQPKTGLILSETDQLNRKTKFEYDNSDNVTELTRLAGTEDAVTTLFDYEPGTRNLTKLTDPLGHSTEVEYGAHGEPLSSFDPLGNETAAEFNRDGQPIAVKNPEGEETKFDYSHGDFVSVTDPLNRTTSRFVDALGRVRAITRPGGQRTLFDYNDADQMTKVTTPTGAETSVEYDADGNPIAIVDPRGNETAKAYDVMDRLESETDALSHSTEWSYFPTGDLEREVDRNGEVSTFSYDPLRRLTTAGYGVAGEEAESTIGYEYDEANRLTDVDDSASGEYGLSYDSLDRLEGLEGPNGAVTYEYDQAGRREGMVTPGLGAVDYEYDDADRLVELEGGGQTVSLGYDKADRLQNLALPNGIEQHYGYDAAGEATSITYGKGESTLGEINYAYDANGLTKSMWGSYARINLPEALAPGEYNAGNELVEREGEELEYDDEGNLISDGSSEYSWDARGQLDGISGAHSAGFAYDPFGRRISKTLGGITTELLYDGPNVVQESVEGSPSAELLTGLTPDQLFSRTTEDGTQSYLTDRIGSVIGLADEAAEVATSYTYDPFGASTEAGAESDNPYQFTGRENDGTGLQYNRARYYSPGDARFISQDPAGFEGSGANLYWYADGNPLDFTDPSGEFSIGVPGDWVTDGPASLSIDNDLLEILGGAAWTIEHGPSADGKEHGPWKPEFKDPTKPPGPGWEWRGKGAPGSGEGAWHKPSTGESLYPDPDIDRHGPHQDYERKDGSPDHRIDPEGNMEPKQ